MDPENRNQLVAIDPRFDRSTILGLDVEEPRRRVFAKKAELHEELIPLSRIRLNRCPFLAPMSAMSDEAALYKMKSEGERPAQMLRRQYARNFPETLGEGEKAKRRSFCAGRLQLPPLAGATDLATFGKVVSQRLGALHGSRVPSQARGTQIRKRYASE